MVTVERTLGEMLSEIQSGADQLNKAADKANCIIAELENKLSGCGVDLDMEAVLIVRNKKELNANGDLVPTLSYLSYGRDDSGDFGFVVRTYCRRTLHNGRLERDDCGDDVYDEDPIIIRLVNAPRSVRVASIEYLQYIVTNILNEIKKQQEVLEKSSTEAISFIGGLKS